MRTFVCCTLAAFALAIATPVRAHVADGTINLTVEEETSAPTGTTAATGGTATLEVTSDLTIDYNVTVHDLTGPALLAHIHAGAAGTAGGVVFPLVKVNDTTFTGETAVLTDAQFAALIAGQFYFNVHTAMNGDGEVRGQITGLEIVHGTCRCLTSTRKDFLKCVRGEIKKLTKEEKKSAEVKALKKAVKRSACGKPKVPKKKPLACCLPINEAASTAVSGKLCAPVKSEAKCTAFGGTLAAGDASCLPTNPCVPPASPSGAFIDAIN